MAIGVMIVGNSGTGKSTSLENLPSEETFIINVQGKLLPFKNDYQLTKDPKEGNMYVSDNPAEVRNLLKYISEKRPDIKNVVIDDWQYLAANEFMRKAKDKGYEKFTSIGQNIWSTIELLRDLRSDLKVMFLAHAEEITDDMGNKSLKVKTAGKLVDNVVTVEGMFTIVLYTDVSKTEEGIEYSFITNNTGNTTAKSPKGMFELRIPNDLNLVANTINEFYNL